MLMIFGVIVLLCAICSTKASRAAGREWTRPYGRAAGVVVVLIWAAIIFLPHRTP